VRGIVSIFRIYAEIFCAQRIAHQPPGGWRSVAKLDAKHSKTENTFTKTLDSKVGFMRW